MYMADQMISAEWGASDTVRKVCWLLGGLQELQLVVAFLAGIISLSVDNTSCTSE